MLRTAKSRMAAVAAAGAMVVGGGAHTASAQPIVVVGGGLVNVTVTDVLNNNTVIAQVPVGVAANVCDVNAAVLVAAIRDTGTASCVATAASQATVGPGNRP